MRYSIITINYVSNWTKLSSRVSLNEVLFSNNADIVKLLVSKGKKRKYVSLLSSIVEAEGHLINENQVTVTNLVMKHRDKILLLYPELKKTM